MIVTKLLMRFSVEQIGNQRVKFQHKICFKNDRLPLKLKTSPTTAIVSRLFRDGKFIKIYKNCQKFYLNFAINNVDRLPPNNEYKIFYHHHQSFKDFNRVLFWKIMSINTIFNLKKLKKRKILYYLPVERRMVLVLMWLKFIIKLNKLNSNNNTERLFKPVYTFVSTQKEANAILNIKLKLYKIRLIRG